MSVLAGSSVPALNDQEKLMFARRKEELERRRPKGPPPSVPDKLMKMARWDVMEFGRPD